MPRRRTRRPTRYRDRPEAAPRPFPSPAAHRLRRALETGSCNRPDRLDDRRARHEHVDDGTSSVAGADLQTGVIAIQLLEARGGVAEAGPGIPADVESGRKTGTGVGDTQVKTRTGQP